MDWWQLAGIALLWLFCLLIVGIARRWYWCQLHRGAPLCTERWIVTGRRK